MSKLPIVDILKKITSLSYDARTDELYIPLPPPYANIRLTPPRATDAPAIVSHQADPLVYKWLSGPPFPYRMEHAEAWLGDRVAKHEEAMEQLVAALDSGVLIEHCPFRTIREVHEDGTETFLGDVGVSRSNFLRVQDPQLQESMLAENNAKALGDPTIVWMIGDYLISSHHGRGIMTCAMRTLLHAWAIPYMAARHFEACVLVGNVGSRRVFEKLGFALVQTTDGGMPAQGKRETELGMWVLEYEARIG